MDKRIHDYCKHICKAQIEVLCTDHKTHSKFWDLPHADGQILDNHLVNIHLLNFFK